jgi:ATP-dependent helicase/nuclease subunit B
MSANRAIFCSPRAAERIAAARAWLRAMPASAELLIVAPSIEAADDLVRPLAFERGALFGVHRVTFNLLIGLLAEQELAKAGIVPVSGLAAEAVAARAIHKLAAADRIGYFAPVADRPGFPSSVARTIGELRLNRVAPEDFERLERANEKRRAGPLAAMRAQFEAELHEARLIDRAGTIDVAIAAAGRSPAPRQVGLPTLIMDLALESVAERDLIAAIASRAADVFATVAEGELRTAELLEAALNKKIDRTGTQAAPSNSLARLQCHLFAGTAPEPAPLDDTVKVMSAPGESRECVEIVREIHAQSHRGVPFDRMAILLHQPAHYLPHLEEALHRGAVPAWFARGAARPDPGGRAMLVLLACAAEKFSARRWAEYLSLAQVPDHALQEQPGGESRFVPPELEFGRAPFETGAATVHRLAEVPLPADPVPVIEGMLRAPWRWEQTIVEASVIGSEARWARRLDGLRNELRRKRSELADDELRAAMIDRQILDLDHLREVAIPQIAALAALPKAAKWSEWLRDLRALAELAIRNSDAVVGALAELEPMAPVGPVELDEVRQILAGRLGELSPRPQRRRYGAVFVGSAAAARGLEFEVVFVPSLAEKLFPRKLIEDPILPDAARRALGRGLATQTERFAAERMALRLAIGAASARVFVSYPRIDIEQDRPRPRVPSFYALEVLRAAEGRLPGFEELRQRAASVRDLRLGWPAPAHAEDAIDEAEYDLAVLEKLVDQDPQATIGTANYLLGANEHLARALRTRARRWIKRWTPADGLVDPDSLGRAALAAHQFDARSFSPTALQHFAACPYRFFLQAIHRLEPREAPEALEAIDPLTRGAMFHEIQFELLSELRAAGMLPVAAQNLADALARAERVLERIAAKYEDELAPAIKRVWDEGIALIRADLREWLRRSVEEAHGWIPERFELAFGLTDREQADPASSAQPVDVAGGLRLRGAIDLIERRGGALRVTDHKTGKASAPKQVVVGKGEVLQPLLYALAAEAMLGEPVESGRLYYCSSTGGYEERVVPLDDQTRDAIGRVIATVGDALRGGFMPAAPAQDKCRFCDYLAVCGPREEMRVRGKPEARLADLKRLRAMP